jgi:hypothetical protein
MELLKSQSVGADRPERLLLVHHHRPVVGLDCQQNKEALNLFTRNEEQKTSKLILAHPALIKPQYGLFYYIVLHTGSLPEVKSITADMFLLGTYDIACIVIPAFVKVTNQFLKTRKFLIAFN